MDLDLDEAAVADNGSVPAADERSLLRRRPSRLVMMSSIYLCYWVLLCDEMIRKLLSFICACIYLCSGVDF